MNVHLLFIGSAGDFFPLLRIGMGLRDAGHQVMIAGNRWASHFAGLVGINYTVVKEEIEGLNPVDDEMISGLVIQDIPLVQQYVKDNYVPGETLFIGAFGYLGAKLAAEELGINIINVLYSPYYINEPLGFSREKTDRHLTERLNNYRKTLGLPVLEKSCSDWIVDSPLKIAVYPKWLERNDIKGEVLYAGFSLPPLSYEPLPGGLEEFLTKDSKKTILFTPGTSLPDTQLFINPVIEAANELGFKCILVFRQKPGQIISVPVSENVFHIDLIPFEQIFHRVDLVIHHGGIGTLSEVLRAGIPQIIKPMYWDQFENGSIVESIGVGKVVTQGDFTSQHIAAVTHELLTSDSVASACREYKDIVERENGIENSVKFLSSIGASNTKEDTNTLNKENVPEIA